MSNQDVNVFFTIGPGRVREEMWSPAAARRATELGFNVRLNPRPGILTPAEWAEAFEGAEALITTWGAPRLDRETLARNSTLRIVGNAAGAVASLVSPELYARGVRVVTANAIMAQMVAEWSLMVTQTAQHHFLDYAGLGDVQDMVWDNRRPARGMQEAVVAIWGYGDISSRLVRLLKPLAPKEILVHSGHLTADEAARAGVSLAAFDELFERGDVIHLLGALTGPNIGKVTARQLAMIRDGATLVNAGRAHLVDLAALLAELRKGRFRAVLDVHYKEPLPPGSPFRGLKGVVLTPHVAGRGKEGLYAVHVLEEFDRFFRGAPLVSEILPDRAATMSDGLSLDNRRA